MLAAQDDGERRQRLRHDQIAPDFLLDRPGALIAALPAVLGFVPEKSWCLSPSTAANSAAVMRVDLSPQLADTVDRIAEVAAAARPDTAIAVIVDAEGRPLSYVRR